MCAKDKVVMEGPSIGKLLNKDLYRSVYNNYVRHTTEPILANRSVPTTWSFLPSWPSVIRHFREWLTFPTTGLKIHVIRTSMSNTSTVPIRLPDRKRPQTTTSLPHAGVGNRIRTAAVAREDSFANYDRMPIQFLVF